MSCVTCTIFLVYSFYSNHEKFLVNGMQFLVDSSISMYKVISISLLSINGYDDDDQLVTTSKF